MYNLSRTLKLLIEVHDMLCIEFIVNLTQVKFIYHIIVYKL